jgi:RNA polymerase sigma factor (TIGR02999 family)
VTDRSIDRPIATDELFPVVYDELKRIAHHHLRRAGRRGQGRATICTTELVHEAFLRLSSGKDPSWESRAHFFGSASRAMRQILVAFAKRRGALKRGGQRERVSLTDADAALELELEQIIAIDAALQELDALNQRLRQVVELRFFGGVPEEEIARILGVSPRTVERDWLKARLFLLRQLAPESA